MLRNVTTVLAALIIVFAAALATTVSGVRAQTPAANLSYDVSSIKVNSSGSGDSHGEFGPHLRAPIGPSSHSCGL